MSPEFLQAFAPYMSGGTATPDDEHANILASIMGDQQTPQPNFSGLSAMASPVPEVRTKRTIGNVLHDLLTDHVDSRGVPVSEKITSLGDAFRNAARTWRGEDPIDTTTPMRTSREQQEEWQRQTQARDAFAALLANPTPERLATLAKLAPDIASSYMTQQQTAQHQTAQEAHQNRVDDFNMSKPVTVGGNTYLTPKAGGGWDEHQTPLPPGYKYVTTGDGQTLVVDQKTGTPIRSLGGPKPGVNKVVTVQDAKGNSVVQMIGPNGELIRTIGAAPPKGKQPEKGDPSAALNALSDIEKGFDDLHNMKALAGEGAPLDFITRRLGIGQAAAEQTDNKAAQKRLAIKKSTSLLFQELLKTLPASATRTKFDQEKISESLPDPSKMDYQTGKDVIAQLRKQIQGSGTVPAASGGITPEQARAELARRRQGQ